VRERLLDQEAGLRRATEAVAAATRELRLGGVVPQAYVFQGAGEVGARSSGVLSEMTIRTDLVALARDIIDTNLYMTIGTADDIGRPWVSPVYYAPAGYKDFFWVSTPEARHSRNVAIRPEISIVIFDSRVPPGTGQAVYMSAVAEELTGADLHPGIDIFSRRSQAHGAGPWEREDVLAPARHRLYRATASEHFVLGPQDERTP
jgi:hypothetical protein